MEREEREPVPVVPLTRPKNRKKQTVKGDRRAERRWSSDDPVVVWRGLSRKPATPSQGWTINACDGGLRVVVDASLKVGEPVGIELSRTASATRHPGRVVWVSPRSDGCIAGIAFGWPTG